jgi:hypothetical protein
MNPTHFDEGKVKRSEHTPTPWVLEYPHNGNVRIIASNGTDIATVDGFVGGLKNEANAAFIVRAVNSYEALTEQNQAMQKALEDILSAWHEKDEIVRSSFLIMALTTAANVLARDKAMALTQEGKAVRK